MTPPLTTTPPAASEWLAVKAACGLRIHRREAGAMEGVMVVLV
jgi:hypothetical protein